MRMPSEAPFLRAAFSFRRRSSSAFISSSDIRIFLFAPCNPRQPVRHEVVTHVLGTVCYPCVRAGHLKNGAARGIRTPDPVITNDVLYRLSYCGGPTLMSRAPLIS